MHACLYARMYIQSMQDASAKRLVAQVCLDRRIVFGDTGRVITGKNIIDGWEY